MRTLATLSITVLVLAAGCTTRAAYEAVRANERNHCVELPDTERDRCLERTRDDYDTYERKKAEAGRKR
jgi:hypothetical protein